MKGIKRHIIIFASFLMLLLLLTSCRSTPEGCPPHADSDSDGVCDVCDEVIEDGTETDYIPDLSGISFPDVSVSYDGGSHSAYIVGELPEGVSVEYSGNGKTNVGEYDVTAKFFYNGKELVGYDITAKLTVLRADYDMSGVRILAVTKTYDGKEVIPELSGELPLGVSASFTVKGALGETVEKMIDVGVYTVYATFTSENDNYYPISPISATVTINAPTVDDVKLEDLTVTYDGTPHGITVTGELPEGVRVVYEGAGVTAVGEHVITAKFYAGDRELVESRLTAVLTIIRASVDMSGIAAEDCTGVYNGEAHKPTVGGVLPSYVEVVYEYKNAIGEVVGEIVNAGSYTVTASFVLDTECYNPINPMSFTYTVMKSEHDVGALYPASLTKEYDGSPVMPTLSGELPDGVTVSYVYRDSLGNVITEIVTVGTYTVVAEFDYDEANYDAIDPITFVYTVTKGSYDVSGISLKSVQREYDGTPVEISYGTLPDGLSLSVVITNSRGEAQESMVDADRYTVTLVFDGDFDNFYRVEAMTATVVIERASVGGISFTDAVFEFDGGEKSIFVAGAPTWLDVTYSGNGVVAPGSYTVTASFGESDNYFPIAPMQAKIIIEMDTNTPTDGILFEKYQDGYAVVGATSGSSVIVIPSTYEGKPVLSVASFAFDGNEELVYIYIPSSVVNIGNRAFSNCTALRAVELGSIKVIGQEAFRNTAITEISLPSSLESIGFGAFEDTRLEKITLPFVGGSRHTSNAYIGFIFGASTYAANPQKVPASLKSVTLANGCTSIPSKAFYGVTSISEVVLGHTVKEIGVGAFAGCSALRSIYIPASVVAIPADAKAENGPFYGTAEDMMIVVETIETAAAWGKYFAHIGEDKTALVTYNKSYDDYVMNKESYRVSDPTDATLVGIFADGKPISGFNPSVYEYELNSDINSAIALITAIPSASGASVTIEGASVTNGNVATVTVRSMDGESTLVYRIRFNVTGSFSVTSEVVNKNGAKGTVTFVIDDGYQPTATFMKSMMEKYERLSVTYAVYTKNFLTTSEVYKTDNGLIIADIDNDGMMEYVLDENGRYTYVRNEETIEFWRDILSVGNSEIIPHSHTHAFWGVNDEGGAQLTASTSGTVATRIYSTLAEGSATKEIYASIQIIRDLFGEEGMALTYVNAGIPPASDDTVVTEEVRVYLAKQTVRVLEDTSVSVVDGKIYLTDITWVDLQSTVGTLPANTPVVTPADTSSGIIPAGTPIYLASDYVTVPTVDNNGNTNIVKGFKAYLDELYRQALADGTFIGARTSGQVVYTASDFLDEENRIYRRAYIIACSTNDARPDSWKKHIDNAIAKDGGWASFCIHAMTEDVNEEGQGAHKINWEQAEDLFAYACSKGDDLWIATQTEATMYYHEWSTASVSSSYDAEKNEITVSLTDGEDDEVYKMPLTVKVSVPGNWATASVNGELLTIRTNDDGSCFVYVDVVPETTVTVLGS